MRLLFVGFDPKRKDLMEVISGCKDQATCFFIESFDVEENLEEGVLSWRKYKSALALVTDIKPDKVIFILLDNYYHFALFLMCKQLGIPRIYLDHGIRFESELQNMKEIDDDRETRIKKLVKTVPMMAHLILFRNSFLLNTWRDLIQVSKKSFFHLIKERFQFPYGRFMERNGAALIPNHFILYSLETLRFYKAFFSLPAGFSNYTLTGIPSLDFWSEIKAAINGDTIILIDQALHEQHIFGWTRENKIKFLLQLKETLELKEIKLAIKPHPWNEDYYHVSPETFVLINTLDRKFIEERVLGITSFNSTLLLGFCAVPGLLTFTFETHPVLPKVPFSIDITKYKTAVPIFNFNELDHLLNNRHQYLEEKKTNIPNYISNMLFKFDGLSKERVTNAIMH